MGCQYLYINVGRAFSGIIIVQCHHPPRGHRMLSATPPVSFCSGHKERKGRKAVKVTLNGKQAATCPHIDVNHPVLILSSIVIKGHRLPNLLTQVRVSKQHICFINSFWTVACPLSPEPLHPLHSIPSFKWLTY